MKKRKILFVALHRPDRSPSQRFRFEQYIDYLRTRGYDSDFSWLISAEDDKVFYKPGNYLKKLGIFLKSAVHRLQDVLKASDYDIIFVQREAFMTGTTLFEKLYSKSKAKLVFDYDDSIWLQNVSEANKALGFLKNADKTRDIIRMSDMIFAGNEYLASFARQYNNNVRIVPTTIDTEQYQRVNVKRPAGKVCVGWSGSFTTIEHFETALPALREIKRLYGDRVYFKVIGDASYRNPELDIVGLPWKAATEVEDLSEIEIGIMPLPDTEWAKGKCGLKGLQYMALEIATIMSPVGVNTEIIRQGENGFLASTTEEWVRAISTLIDKPVLREDMGRKGRRTVEQHYSILSEREHYVQLFNELLEEPVAAR